MRDAIVNVLKGSRLGIGLLQFVVTVILVQLAMFLYLVNSLLIRNIYYPSPQIECTEPEGE